MTTNIVIPPLGESISEAVVASWLKQEGDYVERDEEIVELETDKVTMPLPSPVAGVLRHGAGEGDTVSVGGVVGSVDEGAEKPAGSTESGAVPASTNDPGVATDAAPDAPVESPVSGSDSPLSDVRTTPLAAKLATEHHVPLTQLHATGPGGRVREQDVLAYLSDHDGSAQPAPAESSDVAPEAVGARSVRRERMSQLRQKIASRLVEAQHTAAMLTTFNECDMTRVMALRSRHKNSFLEKHGVKLGFMSFFSKAACSALQAFPSVNASIVDGEKGPEIEYRDYCDIAIAVGTDKGLVVPVLRNAESLGFAGIERGIGVLAEKARENKLTLEEMQGGTFTISNGGVYGSMLSTPILNPPQSGILGLHNILRRAVENPDQPGSGEVVVRPMMYLALSYDHRIVDGAGAVGFLRHVKECIEDPERLMLEV